jgi:ATP-dependent RNA helicase HelY
VWEEVIIHLAPEVDLVCLSATVSNAEEFADWIATVRGHTAAIIEERRPVELTNLYAFADRATGDITMLPTFVATPGGELRPNPEAARHDARGNERGGRGRPRSRLAAPRRSELVGVLREQSMLPVITFIFSRNACDDAVQQCLAAGLRLTDADERRTLRKIADARSAPLTDDDLDALGYGEWLTGFENGIAAHHAGLVPPLKEAVEEAFAAGLVKAVFATETLSLGINMPARSVVIEKLSKFTGEHHEFLTPGEYTQLTGRAGRRGIDARGYAVVCWNPFVPFDQVAGLASRRTSALTSSFRPTYNMATNLVARYEPETAHRLLNLSFAQYRTS